MQIYKPYVFGCEEKLATCIDYVVNNPDWFLLIFASVLAFLIGVYIGLNYNIIKDYFDGVLK